MAPNEREWRSCLYEGIRTIIIPNTTIPEIYTELISEDRKLTDAIEKGQVTRSQRKKRISYLFNEIKRREDEERAKKVAELTDVRETIRGYEQQMEMRDNLIDALGR